MAELFLDSEIAAGTQSGEEAQATAAGPATLAVSVDEFAALEERIRRTVELVKRERQARTEAEERAAKTEEKLQAQSQAAQKLQSELSALRAERDQVRQRVERLLTQLDALEL